MGRVICAAMSASRTIVRTLDPKAEGEDLRQTLAGLPGFSPHQNPSAGWSFRGPGVVIAFYKSGKCVVQGGGADEFAAEFLGGAEGGPSTLETLDTDLVGTDESGKGDYFGPLVTAAVLVPAGQERVLEELGVRDSKQLSDRAAREAARSIRDGYEHEVVVIGPSRYNEMYEGFRNLNSMLGWATAQAAAAVLERCPCENMLSDKFGHDHHIADALKAKGHDVNLVQKVRAESNPAVAAASILARQAFLDSLDRLSKECGMKLPKGAGSPVMPVARKIYQEGGRDALSKVAKLHFKTTLKITGELF
jgi:ribonuclease HIII